MTYTTSLKYKFYLMSTIGLLAVIVWDGLTVLGSRWINDEAYTHGFILAALVGYLILQEHTKIKRTKFGYSWIGFVTEYVQTRFTFFYYL